MDKIPLYLIEWILKDYPSDIAAQFNYNLGNVIRLLLHARQAIHPLTLLETAQVFLVNQIELERQKERKVRDVG